MRIAPFSEENREQVQRVCLETGPGEALTNPAVAAYILNDYCNYYIDNEPENCFVLLDESGAAVGYIICAENYREYRRRFAPYAEIIKKNAGISRIETVAEQIAMRFFSGRYPAHLHIDLLDDYTGKGSGSLLMKAQLENLTAKKVPGVMLIVGSGNKKAIRFYRRHGFRTLISLFGGTVMGRKL